MKNIPVQLKFPFPETFTFNKNQNTELKSCPFCGCEVELKANRTWDIHRRWQWSIQCINCTVGTRQRAGPSGRENTIAAWNSRVNDNEANLLKQGNNHDFENRSKQFDF